MFAYPCALVERVRAELNCLKTDRKGVTALEYGVIAAAIVVAISAVVFTLGTNLSAKFTAISTAL